MWHPWYVSNLENLVADWLPLPDVADALGVDIRKVHSLIRDRALVEYRIGDRRIRAVPSAFLKDGQVLDSLKGTVTVLSDSGFDDDELIRWLFTADDSLPGRPIDALREGRKTEIRRRAQAAGF
ncbi:transcriptional regulator [Zhihengliuella salsuginis]|uniref:Transcriptional regulator n=1 Tax=Zhihengliuella salsuginis TaxID=578222 RepID=A0ABQ3GD11_9MICC|nr:transcriptional regulator [Zhihengliuella salsuginis]